MTDKILDIIGAGGAVVMLLVLTALFGSQPSSSMAEHPMFGTPDLAAYQCSVHPVKWCVYERKA